MNGHNIHAVRFEERYEQKPKTPTQEKTVTMMYNTAKMYDGNIGASSRIEDLEAEVKKLRRMVNQLYYPFTPYKEDEIS